MSADTPAAPPPESAALSDHAGELVRDLRERGLSTTHHHAVELVRERDALRARVAVLEAVARSAALAIQYTPRGPARDELAARLAEAGVHYRG